MPTTVTKFKISFTNNTPQSVDLDLITSLLKINPKLTRIYRANPTDQFKQNTNYWSGIIIEEHSLDLSEAIIYVTSFLYNHAKELEELIKQNSFQCLITIIVKMIDKETPYIKLPIELIRYCANLEIEINFDLIVF